MVTCVVLVAALGLVGATPAGASCAGDASIAVAVAGGGPVFVGTVVSTTNRGRWATFAVEEVWSGDVADTQVVKAGPPPTGDAGSFSGTSADRSYEIGGRYLVTASAGPGPFPLGPGELQDNACSATKLWGTADDEARPATVRIMARSEPIEILGATPEPTSGDDGLLTKSRVGQAGGVIAIVALIALCLWLFFRRGSINHRAEVDVPLPEPSEPEPSGPEMGDPPHSSPA
jgi:hypothetical protein